MQILIEHFSTHFLNFTTLTTHGYFRTFFNLIFVVGALMIQQAREDDQGKYECVARNEHGVIHSKAAHIYVKGTVYSCLFSK